MKFLNRFALIWVLIIVILVIGLFSTRQFKVNLPTQNQPQTSNLYSVDKVIDGDTVDVVINNQIQRIRLIGIDSPEIVDPKRGDQCFGKESSDFAKSILLQHQVSLKSDPTQDDQDKYGRKLRYIYLDDGTFFNELMIAKGYAHEYTYENKPYQYQSDFKAQESNAQAQKLGLWGSCSI